MHVAQRGNGERTHQGVGGRADAAGQDDRLIRTPVIVQDVRDPDAIGDDRQPRHLDQTARDRVGRGPCRDADRGACLDECGGGLGNCLLLGLLQDRLRNEARLEQRAAGERGCTPVHLLDQPLLGE